MRRVVVTGLGLVSPLACGVEATWKKLLSGASGAGSITKCNTESLSTTYACEVPTSGDGAFRAEDWMLPREVRRVDSFIHYGISAAAQAVDDAGWEPSNEFMRCRTGVICGSAFGGLQSIANAVISLEEEKRLRRVSPFFVPAILINLLAGQIAIRYGFKGPNLAVSTACASGAHAIGDAARLIKNDEADVMVAVGAESPICRIGIAGFNACKALSTKWQDRPEQASRPFDQDRDGFVLAEGAGALLLEEYEHAKKRNARIYAEFIGYGTSGDAYHITAPDPNGEGSLRAMKAALGDARTNAGDIDYINAHGTSTGADTIELAAIKFLVGDSISSVTVSSTKSSTGHLLGAAGAIEAIFCALSIRDQTAPPTINLRTPDVGPEFDLAANEPKRRPISLVMSNSFGFGGTNACIVMART